LDFPFLEVRLREASSTWNDAECLGVASRLRLSTAWKEPPFFSTPFRLITSLGLTGSSAIVLSTTKAEVGLEGSMNAIATVGSFLVRRVDMTLENTDFFEFLSWVLVLREAKEDPISVAWLAALAATGGDMAL
jgi:hypothetical protein